MGKKIISLGIVVTFIISVLIPYNVFSYSEDFRSNWIDETSMCLPEAYKKVRCPECEMELYYMPGKDSPYTKWVTYEIPDMDEDNVTDEIAGRKKLKKANEKLKNEFKLLELIESKKEKEKLQLQQKEVVLKKPKYELRQQLTCPYCAHSFFQEGDIIENRKFLKKEMAKEDVEKAMEEASPIEESFSKAIALGVSKDIRQFGYDFFKMDEKAKEEKKAMSQTPETMSQGSILKQAYGTQAQQVELFPDQEMEAPVVPVSSDYIIGPGDTIIINIWGSVQESFPLNVDREGKIMLPKAGPLYIWGFRLEDAEKTIREKLNEYYTNFSLDISMGKLRSMQVFVMGEVKKPGSYNLNAQSNIFQALYASGGPTKLGSMRNIKVIGMDNKERMVDLYPFLLKGQALENSRIQSGDTIFIPTIGDTIAIAGNVKRPGIYEIKGMILLNDILEWAGGITPSGSLQRIQIERIKDTERRIMVDMEYKPSSDTDTPLKSNTLRNGDLVIIAPIVRLKHNFVSILGNIESPGDYALEEDMSVRNIIERAKGFLPATYLYRAEIARVTKGRTREIIPVNLDKLMLGDKQEDILLKEWDILLVYSQSDAQPSSFVEVDGAVNRPGRYELSTNMKVSDLIFKAGSLKPSEFIKKAELFHVVPGESPVVRQINIDRIQGGTLSVDTDIILQHGDYLFIKSEPKFTERKFVTIKGEVRFPGTYPILQGEKLSSLIERAGGFTKEAFLEGAVFSRESIKESQEKLRQRFLEKENRTFLEEQQSILLIGGGNVNTSAVSESLKTRKEMLDYIESVDIEGRMVVKISPVDRLKNTKYDILLENGDMLTISPVPCIITVMGSVNNPTSVIFEDGKGVEYYVQKTGGLTKHANRSGIYILKANGEAVSKFVLTKEVEKGDTIIVPQEFRYWVPRGQLLKDTVQILSSIAVGIGVIAALQ